MSFEFNFGNKTLRFASTATFATFSDYAKSQNVKCSDPKDFSNMKNVSLIIFERVVETTFYIKQYLYLMGKKRVYLLNTGYKYVVLKPEEYYAFIETPNDTYIDSPRGSFVVEILRRDLEL